MKKAADCLLFYEYQRARENYLKFGNKYGDEINLTVYRDEIIRKYCREHEYDLFEAYKEVVYDLEKGLYSNNLEKLVNEGFTLKKHK